MSKTDLDLDEFGAAATVDPPFCERKIIKQSPHTGKIAGFIAKELRRPMRVYTTLRARSHFYYNGDGYAISDSILESLEDHHVSRILIHNGTSDRDTVWEFAIRQYTVDGIPIPNSVNDDPLRDPQTYVKVDDHLHRWPNHAGSLFRRPFREACDRIDWRGYDHKLRDRLQTDG